MKKIKSIEVSPLDRYKRIFENQIFKSTKKIMITRRKNSNKKKFMNNNDI